MKSKLSNIIVGLGNLGEKYLRTRHNAGWMVLDEFAITLGIKEFKPGKGDYYQAEAELEGKNLLLVKPTTFMNNSGLAVAQVLKHYDSAIEDLVVIVDEIQLPVGKLKFTQGGSSGGQNGIQSIIDELETNNFTRLKCGIGNEYKKGELVDYVLSNFTEEQKFNFDKAVLQAKDALRIYVLNGLEKSVNYLNTTTKNEVIKGDKN